jgi:hypothetical protein
MRDYEIFEKNFGFEVESETRIILVDFPKRAFPFFIMLMFVHNFFKLGSCKVILVSIFIARYRLREVASAEFIR